VRRQKRTQGCMIGFFTNHLSFSRMRGVASPELRVRMKSRFKRGGALRLCAYFLWSSGTSLRLCAYFLWSSGTSLRLFAYFHSCFTRRAPDKQGPHRGTTVAAPIRVRRFGIKRTEAFNLVQRVKGTDSPRHYP
jgi:hypothetical protein